MTTRLTRWGHSCVRLERDGTSLVIDPGTFSDLDGALSGTSAILVTHEHVDHLDAERVAAAARDGVDVWGPQDALDAVAGAGAPQERLHAVRHGDTVTVGPFDVAVLGEWHALIHADIPRVANVAYLVDGVLHPGDALVDPAGNAVDVLLTPLGAPWVKLAEVVDWVRAVQPRRIAVIHDVQLSDAGRGLSRTLLGRLAGAGEALDLGPGDALDV
ncbi:MBL fold metallo-hydrolase [Cellulomonas fimi]|uniref:MBL fold metallo-hydrolase n=1 Tax=Cellulomonas fimi TaxID=1708 RepID=UPI00234DF5CB|nr:MBL fold metallo-hydrolase [Cellulomonas fimi]MDC7120504.1 MBL fold metallo-hydrolase [Cellulomonas fimi]